MVTAVLEASQVGLTFGHQRALDAVDLMVSPGSTVALVGRNGSGKTTLLRIVAGLLEPTHGVVLIDGHDPSSQRARAAVSYLPDSPIFFDDLGLEEHAELIGELHSDSRWQPKFSALCRRFGLDDRRAGLPTQYSRGLKQKAALVLGLMRPHRLLLIDEPFVGLDRTGRRALLDVIGHERTANVTVVVATHEPAFLSQASHCVALKDGIVAYDGDPAGVDPDDLM